MITKAFVNVDGEMMARITFKLPAGVWADQIYLVGDFNQWNRTDHHLRLINEEAWQTTVDLKVGKTYQFRYFTSDGRWLNDPEADAYVVTPYSVDNFIVVADPAFVQHKDVS
jgi:1,4-alpha-glucan branching enzyme